MIRISPFEGSLFNWISRGARHHCAKGKGLNVADKDGSPLVAYDSWVEEGHIMIQDI